MRNVEGVFPREPFPSFGPRRVCSLLIIPRGLVSTIKESHPLKPMSEFSNLKPGDDVIVSQHMGGSRMARVDRITPSGRIVIRREVFEPSGRARGYTGWRRPYLKLATPERIAAIRTVENRERLKYAKWDTLPAEFINTVAYHLSNLENENKSNP